MLKYIKKTSFARIFNSRTAAVFVILFMVTWNYNEPFVEFVKEKGCSISWCILPFMMASHHFLAILYFCIIYLNSDVPFLQHANMYQFVRVGRKKWVIGQIAGIVVRTAAVLLAAAVFSALPFLGRLELSNQWGKAVYTLATQRESADFIWGNFLEYMFYYEILDAYTPLQLMALSLVMGLLICVFLGLLMFLVSLFTKRVYAVAAALVMSLMLYFVENTPGSMKQQIARFVPTYWGEIALLKTPSSGYYRLPTLPYMITVLLFLIAGLVVLIIRRVKHFEFNWENEDA